MTADEMFKEIGYEKIENKSRDKITYRYKMGKNKYYEIVFDLLLKQIKIQRTDFCFFTHIQYCGILLEDLKAINKKVEELGW